MKEWDLKTYENLKRSCNNECKKQNSASKYFLLTQMRSVLPWKLMKIFCIFCIFMLLFRNILGKLNMINISYKLMEKAKLLNESGGCSR